MDHEVRQIAQSIGRYPAGGEGFTVCQSGSRKGEIAADSQSNIRLALEMLGLTFRYNSFANVTLVPSRSSSAPVGSGSSRPARCRATRTARSNR